MTHPKRKRGRPTATGPTLTEKKTIRFHPVELDIISRAAEYENEGESEYIRKAALQRVLTAKMPEKGK